MRRNLVLIGSALIALIATPAFAAVINWGNPTTISGDSNVSTDGALFAAYHMNGGDVTVNGVLFIGVPVTSGATVMTFGPFSFTESPGHFIALTGLGSNSAPFSNLSANYQTLLSTAISTDENNTLTLTMTGLSIGQQYEFEWWLNASSATSTTGLLTTATATNSVTLDDNTTNTVGGVGQFAIGTFTADATSQVIAFSGINSSNSPTVNAFQFRAIPEPSTMSILLLGGVAIRGARFLRRKK